jgi:hypothetical protein
MRFINAFLRLMHISSTLMWVGLSFSDTLFVIPAQKAAREKGVDVTRELYYPKGMLKAYPFVALVSAMTGVLLYLTGIRKHFSPQGNVVLGIGAISGAAAFIHGLPLHQAYDDHDFAARLVAENPTPENVVMLDSSLDQLQRSAWISHSLMILATLGMGSARYL